MFGTEKVTGLEPTKQRISDDASLVDYYIPSSLTSVNVTNDYTLAYGAFMNCANIENVSISNARVVDSVSTPFSKVGDYAFASCSSLKSIKLPTTTQTLGKYAFYMNTELETVTYGGTNITAIREFTFYGDSKLKKFDATSEFDVNIPTSVMSIAESAFENATSIKSVNVGALCSTIGAKAFKNLESMQKLFLAEGVKSLGKEAFMNAYSLNSLVLPSTLGDGTTGDKTFENATSLSSLTIRSGVNQLSSYMFNNTPQLTSIEIPATVTAVGTHVFANSGITAIDLSLIHI